MKFMHFHLYSDCFIFYAESTITEIILSCGRMDVKSKLDLTSFFLAFCLRLLSY